MKKETPKNMTPSLQVVPKNITPRPSDQFNSNRSLIAKPWNKLGLNSWVRIRRRYIVFSILAGFAVGIAIGFILARG